MAKGKAVFFKKLHDSDDRVELLKKLRETVRSDWRTLRHSTVSAHLEYVCMKCLNIEPRQRYESAESLHGDLKDSWKVQQAIEKKLATSRAQPLVDEGIPPMRTYNVGIVPSNTDPQDNCVWEEAILQSTIDSGVVKKLDHSCPWVSPIEVVALSAELQKYASWLHPYEADWTIRKWATAFHREIGKPPLRARKHVQFVSAIAATIGILMAFSLNHAWDSLSLLPLTDFWQLPVGEMIRRGLTGPVGCLCIGFFTGLASGVVRLPYYQPLPPYSTIPSRYLTLRVCGCASGAFAGGVVGALIAAFIFRSFPGWEALAVLIVNVLITWGTSERGSSRVFMGCAIPMMGVGAWLVGLLLSFLCSIFSCTFFTAHSVGLVAGFTILLINGIILGFAPPSEWAEFDGDVKMQSPSEPAGDELDYGKLDVVGGIIRLVGGFIRVVLLGAMFGAMLGACFCILPAIKEYTQNEFYEDGKKIDIKEGGISALCFAPDGRHLLIGTSNGTITLYDLVENKRVATFQGHTGIVRSIAIGEVDSDRRMLSFISCSGYKWHDDHQEPILVDAGVRIWSFSHPEQATYHIQLGQLASGVAVSPTRRNYAFVSSLDYIRVYDLTTGRQVSDRELSFPQKSLYTSIVISADYASMLAGDKDGVIWRWNATVDKPPSELGRHTRQIRSLAISPDGKLAVSGGDDGRMRVWDLTTSRLTFTLYTSKNDLDPGTIHYNCVAFSPNGKRILSGSGDGRVGLLDIDSYEQKSTWRHSDSAIWAIAFSPDRLFAVSGSEDGTLRVWKLPD